MRQPVRVFILLSLVAFLPSCSEEEIFYNELVLVGGSQVVSPVICAYEDSVWVVGEPDMQGSVTVTLYESMFVEHVRLEFLSGSILLLKYKNQDKLKNLKTLEYDFGNPWPLGPQLELEAVFMDGSQRKMYPVSGKLYLLKQSDGSMKIDWCAIRFHNSVGGEYRDSYGGCRVTF